MNNPTANEQFGDTAEVEGAGIAPDEGFLYTFKVKQNGATIKSSSSTSNPDGTWITGISAPTGGWTSGGATAELWSGNPAVKEASQDISFM